MINGSGQIGTYPFLGDGVSNKVGRGLIYVGSENKAALRSSLLRYHLPKFDWTIRNPMPLELAECGYIHSLTRCFMHILCIV